MLHVLIIACGAVAVGFFLIFLLALADKQARKKRPASEETGLTRPQFEKACVEVVERMKLEIEEILRTEDGGLDIRATNPAPFIGGMLFVRCVYLEPGGVIPAAEVLELSSAIIQERLTKAIFITNARFAEDIGTLSELAPMEFIDGTTLQGLMKKYSVLASGD